MDGCGWFEGDVGVIGFAAIVGLAELCSGDRELGSWYYRWEGGICFSFFGGVGVDIAVVVVGVVGLVVHGCRGW